MHYLNTMLSPTEYVACLLLMPFMLFITCSREGRSAILDELSLFICGFGCPRDEAQLWITTWKHVTVVEPFPAIKIIILSLAIFIPEVSVPSVIFAVNRLISTCRQEVDKEIESIIFKWMGKCFPEGCL